MSHGRTTRASSSGEPAVQGRLVALGAVSGIVGPVLFGFVILLAGSQYDGYSHLADEISELGARDSPVWLWQSANFVLLGLFLLVFAGGFQQAFRGRDRLTQALLVYFPVGALIGNGLFRCDPGCENVTLVGRLHEFGAATGFLALVAAWVLLARRMRRDDEWAALARYTWVSSFVSVALLVVWLVSRDALPGLAGGIQRLMVLAFLQWFVVMGVVILRR